MSLQGQNSACKSQQSSFSMKVGAFKRSKKELEKQRKEEEEKAAAAVYEEFVATFDKPESKGAKLFVRGSIMNAPSEEKITPDCGEVYKPQKLEALERKTKGAGGSSSSNSLTSKFGFASIDKPEKPPKKKEKEKKKSNLELFKEELKQMQEEREERHRLKAALKEAAKSGQISLPEVIETVVPTPKKGSYDTGDPNTTNIYLGNLNPETTEQHLMEYFGKYGPLASVKIMWPRTDEERARNRNCGFVAYMCRKDGERALKKLNGCQFMGFEMKLGWGKAVPIPPHPIYVPPKMREMTMPPPPSGLPFSAQPAPEDKSKCPPPGTPWPTDPVAREEFNKMVERAVIKVVIPTDRQLLALIHRMVEFVVREGPIFEAMIMNKELSNPMFRFLFDNHSAAHVYYRWRLFSVLQGDSTSKWRTEEFRMFKGGSVWKPPPVDLYLKGMPRELLSSDDEEEEERLAQTKKDSRSRAHESDDDVSSRKRRRSRSRSRGRDSRDRSRSRDREPDSRRFRESKYDKYNRGGLSDAQRQKFEDMLRNLTPERPKIEEAMIYCIDHSEAAQEIVDCIAESLSIKETPLHKKIARIYLVSDVLYNCSAKVTNASYYRKGFQSKIIEIFHHLHECYAAIDGRIRGEQFKNRVMAVIRAWIDWALYTTDILIKLQNIFLGIEPAFRKEEDSDVDGRPLDTITDNPDVDGIPIGTNEDEDIDGKPLGAISPLKSSKQSMDVSSKFKPSKWETVDPSVVEKQAFTTSKWETIEPSTSQQGPSSSSTSSSNRQNTPQQASNSRFRPPFADDDDDDEDIDGVPLEESNNNRQQQPQYDDDSNSRSSQFLDKLREEIQEERRNKLREIEVKVLQYQEALESGHEERKSGYTISEQIEEFRQRLIRKSELQQGNDRERERDRDDSSRSQPESARRHHTHHTSRHSHSHRSSSSSRHHRSRGSSSESPSSRSRSPSSSRSRSRRYSRSSSSRSRSRSRSRSHSPSSSRSPYSRSQSRSRSRTRSKSPRSTSSRSHRHHRHHHHHHHHKSSDSSERSRYHSQRHRH